jgi:hypothetical protein
MSEATNGEKARPDGGIVRAGGTVPLGGIERRRYPRFNFSAPVFVRMVLEEETFNPLRFMGHSRNISASGVLVEIEDLPENLYRSLIRSQRMVRVHAHIPETEGETVFFGKIVWYDYRATAGRTSCLCGVSFETLNPKAQTALTGLLQRLEANSQSLPKTEKA